MRVTFNNYENLLSNLLDISLVAEDAMSSDDVKNIIFKFTRDSIQLIGVSRLVVFKRTLSPEIYHLEIDEEELDNNGYAFMQVKSKEIISYLSTYKALKKTKVESVELSLVNKLTIVCKIAEVAKEDDESFGADTAGKAYLSSYTFNNIAIKPNMIGQINMKADLSECATLPVLYILFHTRNMLPILKNDTSLFGQLVIGDDGVVVAHNASFTTYMGNVLPECFGGTKISNRALSLIDKLFSADETVQCKKVDNYIYIHSEDTNSEVFIVYDSKLPNYQMQRKLFVKDHRLSLDRVYLRDILKRLSLTNDSISVSIKCEDNIVDLKNSKFHQTISILDKAGLEEYSSINFKILPESLNKAIIGSDDEFSDELYIYFCPQPNGDMMLAFADNSDKWFSTVKVKPTK